MLPPPFQHALVLTGPTGSGKSQQALLLAQRLDAEIISMDSMALYRGMDIGTAKPTPEERAAAMHHLIDVLDPWDSSSVAWWLDRARQAALDIQARGKQVLLVGGTPLYLKGILFGLFEGPAADTELRRRLEAEATERGAAVLHARLAAVDPVSAARLHANDLRRVIRALEVFTLTGRPISAWQKEWSFSLPPSGAGPSSSPLASGEGPSSSLPPCGGGPGRGVSDASSASSDRPTILWLDLPRDVLYERINRRVIQMFDAGLAQEVQRLRDNPRGMSKEARQALGYKETLSHLEGKLTLEETIAEIQLRTRRFAKRQITWFRHLPGCRPVSLVDLDALTAPLSSSLFGERRRAQAAPHPNPPPQRGEGAVFGES